MCKCILVGGWVKLIEHIHCIVGGILELCLYLLDIHAHQITTLNMHFV